MLTPELIADRTVALQPAISLDGRQVAYVLAQASRREDRRLSALWLAAADGSSPPRQLTDGTTADSGPRWAPDSGSIFFRSDRTGSDQLYRIGLDGGEPEALTDWHGKISDARPLADGRLVAVVATAEPTEEDKRRRAERDDAIAWAQRLPRGLLHLLDLETRELRVVRGLGDRHVVAVVQRPGGGPLAVISRATPEADPRASPAELHLVAPETGRVRDLGPLEAEASSPAWWLIGDTWHLAYLAITPPGTVGGFAVMDLTVPDGGTAGEHRNLTAGMTGCPTLLAQVTDGPPLALFADGLDSPIYRLDPGTRRFRRLSVRRGDAESLSASRSGAMIAVLASTAYEPKNVHAGHPAGELTRLTDTQPDLRRAMCGTQERLSYRASDGLDLDGLLILPVGKSRADGPFPLITVVHGGPYDRYADQFHGGLYPAGQWLATAGYAVFLPNPRGGLGHGHEFAATVAGRVGLEEWTDIVSGIDLLVAGGVADPNWLGIAGGSHGGFMAAWAIGQSDRFKAAIMSAGISDWGMQVAAGDFGASEGDLSGSCGWEGPGPHAHDWLSPISYAAKIRTPVLILHGEDDTNVPLGQATYFHRALSQFGVEHEFVVYPREGHGIQERSHQLDVLRRSRAWFDRWLRT